MTAALCGPSQSFPPFFALAGVGVLDAVAWFLNVPPSARNTESQPPPLHVFLSVTTGNGTRKRQKLPALDELVRIGEAARVGRVDREVRLVRRQIHPGTEDC